MDGDIFGLFPHDIMHDVLEGVIPVTVRLVLLHYLTTDFSQQVCLADINAAIDSCSLTNATNRPNHITLAAIHSHLSGSASHKFELFLMLPRILATLVELSVSDGVWAVYLALHKICDVIFAPVVELDQLKDLQHMIAEFMRTFVEIFGAEKLLPKFHYLLHYPRQIALFNWAIENSVVHAI